VANAAAQLQKSLQQSLERNCTDDVMIKAQDSTRINLAFLHIFPMNTLLLPKQTNRFTREQECGLSYNTARTKSFIFSHAIGGQEFQCVRNRFFALSRGAANRDCKNYG
jgi:hypothetical protein